MIYYSHVFSFLSALCPDYKPPSHEFIERVFGQLCLTGGIFRQFVYAILASAEQLIHHTISTFNFHIISPTFNLLTLPYSQSQPSTLTSLISTLTPPYPISPFTFPFFTQFHILLFLISYLSSHNLSLISPLSYTLIRSHSHIILTSAHYS